MAQRSPRLLALVVAAALTGTIALAALGLTAGNLGLGPGHRPAASAEETAPSPTPTPGSPLAGLSILVDPGHSGALVDAERLVPDGRGGHKACNNSGTQTTRGFPEHSFNWQVATRLAEILRAEGATVTLTRTDDTSMGPCVDKRGQLTRGHDAAVSIHANGTFNPGVRGYFALVSSPPLNDAQGAPSLALARSLLASLSEAGFVPSNAVDGQISYRADLAGLNFAECPTVMMELGEMRNDADAQAMVSGEGQQRYAAALAAGLRTWARERP